MTKETFTAKSYTFKVLSAFFALGSIFFLFRSHAGWSTYLLAILGLGMAYIFWRVPPLKIEVDDLGIKRSQHGNSGTGLISRIVQPDTGCEWNWIHSVSTRRLNSGSFLTALYLTEDIPDKPKHRVTIESFIFKDYVPILKIIKARAAQAHFDETTELILDDQIDIRPVSNIYWWIFIIVVLSAFLYLHYRKG